ncbi:transcriptional regulator [Metarhizobium album]|uniref:Transcriptional regulator n=1 Tax=Metarhizobium album TaxID=2182425 RepID=A0A2U2DFM3_9HYPH|nr:helix-turn-helix transcriptional regulator [Rhizobium album]PWE52117.1 transcriptional regulator [Rhizobium album]
MAERNPNPIDVTVGGRIQRLRTAGGMTQSKLAEALGISFQQVQKYENGLNRVSGSRLQQIASALNVTVSDLFSDPPPSGGAQVEEELIAFIQSQQGRALNEGFQKLPPELRKAFLALVKSLQEPSPLGIQRYNEH